MILWEIIFLFLPSLRKKEKETRERNFGNTISDRKVRFAGYNFSTRSRSKPNFQQGRQISIVFLIDIFFNFTKSPLELGKIEGFVAELKFCTIRYFRLLNTI